MFDKRNYRQFIEELGPEDREKLRKAFGGESSDPDHYVRFIGMNPQHEASLCLCIKSVFGVDILTHAELAHHLHLSASEAAVESANHAKDSNEIAKAANCISERANAISEDANRIAKEAKDIAGHAKNISFWNTAGTIVAALVAIAALIVAVLK